MESADSCANETRLEQDFCATEACKTNIDDVSACERGSWVHFATTTLPRNGAFGGNSVDVSAQELADRKSCPTPQHVLLHAVSLEAEHCPTQTSVSSSVTIEIIGFDAGLAPFLSHGNHNR